MSDLKRLKNHSFKMRLPMKFPICLTTLCLCMAVSDAAALTFEFSYTDEGAGFDDPVHGQARRDALELAGDILGSTAFGAYDAVITVTVSGSEQGDLLASAGSNSVEDVSIDGGVGDLLVVRNKILFDEDLNGNDFDAEVSWNFADYDWQLDIDVMPLAHEYDFYSTAYHELTHALGWADSFDFPSGRDVFDVGIEEPGQWNLFDSFLVEADGTPMIDPDTYLNTSADFFIELAQGGVEQGIFFNGENAVAANGGFLVPLYTPAPFEQGSSITHLDDDAEGMEDFMMLSASDPGAGNRQYSEIALGVLKDLGYEDAQQIGLD
jgi:hypothetical protein